MSATNTVLYLLVFALGFAAVGIFYTNKETLENYLVARNSQGTVAICLTLMASSLGAWILFAPAQAATWGGIGAIIGYSMGAIAPRLLMIPLGLRIKALMPKGHTLSEYVLTRYSSSMYLLILAIMLFYLFISLAAEVTAMAKLINLIAPIPLWVTAGIVLVTTLLYTLFGGLKASIFTDKIQMIIIIPLLISLCFFGWQATQGISPIVANLSVTKPELLDLSNISGIKAGLTFFVAILLTGLFHQGNWQRVFAAKSVKTIAYGYLLAGVLVAPVIFIMGLFGLAYISLNSGTDSSIALFSVVMPSLPAVFVILLIPLGLSLVMSSADTAINAISSLIAVDMRRLMPGASTRLLFVLARFLVIPIATLVWLVAAKGYSVLYLFLLADLLCSAAAFPVFFGLYNRHYNSKIAFIATISGLSSGLAVFPAPSEPSAFLLESFLLAAIVPVIVSWILLLIMPKNKLFNFQRLNEQIKSL